MFAFLLHAQRISLVRVAFCLASAMCGLAMLPLVCDIQWTPGPKADLFERLLSFNGAVREGRIAAMAGQSGYQALVLRGGLYLLCWNWARDDRRVGRVGRAMAEPVTGKTGEVEIARNAASRHNAALVQVAGVPSLAGPTRPFGG